MVRQYAVMMGIASVGLGCATAGTPSVPAVPIPVREGYWSGTAAVGPERTAFALRVTREGGGLQGAIDLPELGVLGWPAKVEVDSASGLRVEFASDDGINVLTGRLSARGLRGRWDMPGSTDTALVSLASANPGPAPRTRDINFRSGDISLAGTVVLPEGIGPWPAVVFVHGAGAESRDASRFLAIYYAERGIASLIYDKRGVGQSEGDWRTSDFETLANDVLAGVAVLSAEPGVDPRAIGVRGQSQGGWVAPLAASRSTRVAFVVTVAGPLVSPAEEGHWDTIYSLRAAGHDSVALAEADSLLARRDEAVRTSHWSRFRDALAVAARRPWFQASGLGGEVDPDAWIWAWYRRVMDWNPVPVFARLTVPVLAQYGAQDESMPAEKSAAMLASMRDQYGQPFTVRIYPSANHAMRTVAAGTGFRWPAYVEGYLSDQVRWIRRTKPRVDGGSIP